MRVLLTGVTGQIGGALHSRLLQVATVLAADRTMLDLAQPGTIAEVLDRFAPDLIINPAAYTAVDKAEDEPDLAMRVNGEAPAIMARWAADRRVPLIHFSTDYVYDGDNKRAWSEDDNANPLSVYGTTKLAGDSAIRACGGSFLIIRTCWIYSAQGDNFLRTIIRLAQERKELRVVDDQIGAPTSAALIADTVVRIVARGIADIRERSTQSDGLVHIAASGAATRHGFACAIVDGLKSRGVRLAVENVMPIRTDEYPTSAKRPLNSRLDITRLQKVFGIVPPQWDLALAPELDQLAHEIGSTKQSAA